MKYQNQKTENIDLIRKIAWSFYNTTGVDWDELFAEASLAYAKGLESYDPSRGRITTHMWYKISNHLKDYLKQEMRDNGHIKYVPEYEEIFTTPVPFFESLSNDAREIANIILRTPVRFGELNRKQVRERIKHLMANRGWSDTRIEIGIKDLQFACTNPN